MSNHWQIGKPAVKVWVPNVFLKVHISGIEYSTAEDPIEEMQQRTFRYQLGCSYLLR